MRSDVDFFKNFDKIFYLNFRIKNAFSFMHVILPTIPSIYTKNPTKSTSISKVKPKSPLST